MRTLKLLHVIPKKQLLDMFSEMKRDASRCTTTTRKTGAKNEVAEEMAKTRDDIHSVAVSLTSIAKKYTEKD